jgi:hypothetical protein
LRTSHMTLETFETFIVKLACGFASTVLLVLLLGLLLLIAGFTESSFAQELQAKGSRSLAKSSNALLGEVRKEDEQIRRWLPT